MDRIRNPEIISLLRDKDEGRPEDEKPDEASEPLKPILKLEGQPADPPALDATPQSSRAAVDL